MRPKTASNILARIQDQVLIEEPAAIGYGTSITLKETGSEEIFDILSTQFRKREQISPLTEKEKAKSAMKILHNAIKTELSYARNRFVFLVLIVIFSGILTILAYIWSDMTGTLTTFLGGGVGSSVTFATVKDSVFSYFDTRKYLAHEYSLIEFEYNQGNYKKVSEMVRKELNNITKSAH